MAPFTRLATISLVHTAKAAFDFKRTAATALVFGFGCQVPTGVASLHDAALSLFCQTRESIVIGHWCVPRNSNAIEVEWNTPSLEEYLRSIEFAPLPCGTAVAAAFPDSDRPPRAPPPTSNLNHAVLKEKIKHTLSCRQYDGKFP